MILRLRRYRDRIEDILRAVTSAHVIRDRETGRSKGFEFVEMQADDAAQRAIGCRHWHTERLRDHVSPGFQRVSAAREKDLP